MASSNPPPFFTYGNPAPFYAAPPASSGASSHVGAALPSHLSGQPASSAPTFAAGANLYAANTGNFYQHPSASSSNTGAPLQLPSVFFSMAGAGGGGVGGVGGASAAPLPPTFFMPSLPTSAPAVGAAAPGAVAGLSLQALLQQNAALNTGTANNLPPNLPQLLQTLLSSSFLPSALPQFAMAPPAHTPTLAVPRNGMVGITRRAIVLWEIADVRMLRAGHPRLSALSQPFPVLLRQFFQQALDVELNSFPIYACCTFLQSNAQGLMRHLVRELAPHGVIVTAAPERSEGKHDVAVEHYLSAFHSASLAESSKYSAMGLPLNLHVVVMMSSNSDLDRDVRTAKLNGYLVVVICLPSQGNEKFLRDCTQLGIYVWNWLDVLSSILGAPVAEADLEGRVDGVATAVAASHAQAQPQPQPQHQSQHHVQPVAHTHHHASAHVGSDPAPASAVPAPAAAPAAAAATAPAPSTQKITNLKPSFAFNSGDILYSRYKGEPKRKIIDEVLKSVITDTKFPEDGSTPYEGMQTVFAAPSNSWQIWYFPEPPSPAWAHTFLLYSLRTQQWHVFTDHEVAAGGTASAAEGAATAVKAATSAVVAGASAVPAAGGGTGHHSKLPTASAATTTTAAGAGGGAGLNLKPNFMFTESTIMYSRREKSFKFDVRDKVMERPWHGLPGDGSQPFEGMEPLFDPAAPGEWQVWYEAYDQGDAYKNHSFYLYNRPTRKWYKFSDFGAINRDRKKAAAGAYDPHGHEAAPASGRGRGRGRGGGARGRVQVRGFVQAQAQGGYGNDEWNAGEGQDGMLFNSYSYAQPLSAYGDAGHSTDHSEELEEGEY